MNNVLVENAVARASGKSSLELSFAPLVPVSLDWDSPASIAWKEAQAAKRGSGDSIKGARLSGAAQRASQNAISPRGHQNAFDANHKAKVTHANHAKRLEKEGDTEGAVTHRSIAAKHGEQMARHAKSSGGKRSSEVQAAGRIKRIKRDEDTESLNDAVNNAKGKDTSDVMLNVKGGKVIGYKSGDKAQAAGRTWRNKK